jgi:hypothetical protein
MKTLIAVLLVTSSVRANDVGCVVSLRTHEQLVMNDLKPASPIGQKMRLKGSISGYNILVTVAENKSVLRVTVKSQDLALTTYTPLNTNSARPRVLLAVPQGILELRCRRWTL